MRNRLSLTKASITKISTAGMGDRVCVDLCSLMRRGEGLLVWFMICCSWVFRFFSWSMIFILHSHE